MAVKRQFRVTGLAEVTRNLNKEIKKINGDVRKGMQKVGLKIKTAAREITPRDTSVLMQSAFYSTGQVNGDWVVRIGYTASYAAAVHEMPASNNWTMQGTSSKFLFNAVMNNRDNILRWIKEAAKVK